MFEKIIEISMLYDFYGQLLTARQREILKLYYEDNFSLSEVAETFGISRQGVHDAIKKAEKALREYEEKLGLVRKFVSTEEAVAAIDKEIDQIIAEYQNSETLTGRLESIKKIIDGMNE